MFAEIIKIAGLAALLIIWSLFAPVSEKKDIVPDALVFSENFDKESVLDSDKAIDAEILLLQAKAVYIFDLFKNEAVFEKNADRQLPLASLAKLMTAIVAKENLPETTLIPITKEAVAMEGDSGLAIGEIWSLNELIDIMLISSSNDAAFAIASSLRENEIPNDSFFVDLMNAKAAEMGISQTYFLNSTGLDISATEGGAYGTAKDMTILMRYIMQNHPEILEPTRRESITLGGRIFKNTNKLLPKLPFYIGGKTGFDDLISGGNLMVAVDKGFYHPMIIVVLGSTEEGRFEDVEMLYNKYTK